MAGTLYYMYLSYMHTYICICGKSIFYIGYLCRVLSCHFGKSTLRFTHNKYRAHIPVLVHIYVKL